MPETIKLEELLTPSELCSLLKKPKSWLYRQTREHAIPFTRCGKYLMFHKPSIEKWLAQNTVLPID